MASNFNYQHQHQALAPAFSGDLDFESSGSGSVSVTEYETDSAYSVTIENEQKETQRRLIPADYDGLIGDLDIPDYAAQSPPYHLKKKPDYNYNTLCSGLTAESLQYFQHPTKRRRDRVVSGAVIRNLNPEFDELAQPSPRPEVEKGYLPLPKLVYGTTQRQYEDRQRFGINSISTSDTSSYGSQLYLRRKTVPQVQPPNRNRYISENPEPKNRRASQNQDDNNTSCVIA